MHNGAVMFIYLCAHLTLLCVLKQQQNPDETTVHVGRTAALFREFHNK